MQNKKKNVLFIVNQQEDSIFGRRVKNLTGNLNRIMNCKVIYRDNNHKIKSMFGFFREILNYKPRIIYLEPMAYSGCMAVLLAKLFVKFKLIFCISDAYSELIKANHSWLVVFTARIFEKIWIKSADFILTWSPVHADWIRNNMRKSNVDYIENGVDLNVFKSLKQKKLRERLGLGKSSVVGLVGSLKWSKRYKFCYGWDAIRALKYLKDLDVKVLIIGDGSGLSHLKQKAEDYGIEKNVVFTGAIPYNKIPDYINCMDICLSTQSNDLVGYVRCPTKIAEYMACGKYIISTDVGYAKLYVGKIGELLPYFGVKDESYPKRLAIEIRRLMKDRKILDKGKKGRMITKSNFDWKILSKKLENLLKRVY